MASEEAASSSAAATLNKGRTDSWTNDSKGYRLPFILSPYHWIHILSAKLSVWVSGRVLCSIAILELVGHILFAALYIRFRLLASNGVLFFYDWTWWFALATIRGLISIFGVVVVCQRKVQLVRAYFLLYVVSCFIGILVFVPIFRTSCQCDRFLQCHALKAFEHDIPLINSFPPPDNYWARKLKTRMRVQSLPSTDDSALTILEAKRIAKQHASTLVVDDEEEYKDGEGEGALVQTSSWTNISHLASSGGSHTLDQTSSSDYSSLLARTWRHALRMRSGTQSSGAKEDAGMRILSWWRTRAIRRTEVLEDGMLGMFYASPQRFKWISTSSRKSDHKCKPVPTSTLEAMVVQSKLDSLRDNPNFGKTSVLDLGHAQVLNSVFKCFSKSDCQLVAVKVDWAKGVPSMKICKITGAMEIREVDDDEAKVWTFELRREDQRLEGSAGRQSIYQLGSKKLRDPLAAMYRIQHALDSECFCDPDRSGCKAFEGEADDRFWCWISDASVFNCALKGYKVHSATSHGKTSYFTDGVCTPPTTTCACTHLGMYPRAVEEKHLPENVQLWENKLNYGASCKKWSTEDTLAWCFVGFDSNCMDKYGRDQQDHYTGELDGHLAGGHGNGKPMPQQFKSSIPCNHESQETAFSNAQTTCLFVVTVMTVVFFLQAALWVPVTFMLHQFLAHRCSDNLVVQEQFEVNWSDDEWEYEDEEEGHDSREDLEQHPEQKA